MPRLLMGAALLVVLGLALTALLTERDADGLPEARLLETTPPAGLDLPVGVQAGLLAPDFIVAAPDGRTIRLSDLRGRAVMINFWATWCGSCLAELPEIKALQAEVGTDRLVVLAVNAGEGRRRALEYIDFLEAPFAWALDPFMTITDGYGVYGLPLSVFVDANGVIQAVYRGHASRPLLQRFVQAAIDATPPGEVAPVIRLLTPIPRERVVTVTRGGAGRLEFGSKTLRCDFTYCADGALQALRSLGGVSSVQLRSGGPEPVVVVRYDRRVVTEAAIIEALKRALEGHADPLYQGPLEVRLNGGS